MLDESCRVLKITDFGEAEVFKTQFEQKCRNATGIHGTDPYIAPEEFEDHASYDSRKVDVWACGK